MAKKDSSSDKNIYRVLKIRVKKGHPLFNYFDQKTFFAKNLYNIGNFYRRQLFTGLSKEENLRHANEKEVIAVVNNTISLLNSEKTLNDSEKIPLRSSERKSLNYGMLDGIFKKIKQPDYCSLPAQVNQQALKRLCGDWDNFFKSLKDYKENPDKYKKRPGIPKYKKKNGRMTTTFTNQVCKIQNSQLKFPKTKDRLNLGKYGFGDECLKEVRVVPTCGVFEVEIVLQQKDSEKISPGNTSRVIGIDLGVDNFATISNNFGEQPIIIKGKVIKSINQYYNKQKAHYYSILRQGQNENTGQFHSHRLNRLNLKRKAKLNDFMHKASFKVVEYCIKNQVGTIVAGKNPEQKQNINIGSRNNQNFVGIPFARFCQMLEYKAKEKGIDVIFQEESYTSKASFLDDDDIPSYGEAEAEKCKFSGKRKRGIYKRKNGKLINADINAAFNIIKKAIPDAFDRLGNRGIVFHPLVLSVA